MANISVLERRKQENLAIRREGLRLALKGRQYLAQLVKIDRTLRDQWETLTSTQVSALRLRAELQFKRLEMIGLGPEMPGLPNLAGLTGIAEVTSRITYFAATPGEQPIEGEAVEVGNPDEGAETRSITYEENLD